MQDDKKASYILEVQVKNHKMCSVSLKINDCDVSNEYKSFKTGEVPFLGSELALFFHHATQPTHKLNEELIKSYLYCKYALLFS